LIGFFVFSVACVLCALIGQLSPDQATRQVSSTMTVRATERRQPGKTPTPSSTPMPYYTLLEAVEQGLVEVSIHGEGRVAGSSMTLVIERLTDEPIEVDLERGTVLVPDREGYQNMLVTTRVLFFMREEKPRTVELDAYCMNAYKEPPSSEVVYTAAPLDDGMLVQLVEGLFEMQDEKYMGESPLLGAIWSLTDDLTITQIQDRLFFGYDAVDVIKAKLILERAGIETEGRALFSPQNEAEEATWHEGLGDYAYWTEQEHDVAVAEYTEAIEHRSSAALYQKRAFVHRETKDFASALDDLDSAIELDPQYTYHESKAELHAELGAYDEAVEEYGQAIASCPYEHNIVYLLQERAEMCLESGDYEQAIEDYTGCIEIQPDQAWRYHARAKVYEEAGDYEAAIADCTTAMELEPEVDMYIWCRAKAYAAAGQTEEAIADYERIVAMGGGWATAAEMELEQLGEASQ
jgi:tetratricopeptide (TPR) repeat protein